MPYIALQNTTVCNQICKTKLGVVEWGSKWWGQDGCSSGKHNHFCFGSCLILFCHLGLNPEPSRNIDIHSSLMSGMWNFIPVRYFCKILGYRYFFGKVLASYFHPLIFWKLFGIFRYFFIGAISDQFRDFLLGWAFVHTQAAQETCFCHHNNTLSPSSVCHSHCHYDVIFIVIIVNLVNMSGPNKVGEVVFLLIKKCWPSI